MNIIIPKQDTGNYQVGDLFITSWSSKGTVTILLKNNDGYVLRPINNENCYSVNGHFDSIENLFYDLHKHNINVLKHFSKDEYELKIVKKDGCNI